MINIPAALREDVKKLKIKKEYFDEVQVGNKRAELRFNDRDYREGEVYLLQEIDEAGTYTERELLIRITHILKAFEGLREGWCIFSFEIIPVEEDSPSFPLSAQENKEPIELRASCFWLEKIEDILRQYRSKQAWESFARTKGALKRAVDLAEFTSAITLSHVFTILDYCQNIIREAAYDRAYSDIWKYKKDNTGAPIEFSLKITIAPPEEKEQEEGKGKETKKESEGEPTEEEDDE